MEQDKLTERERIMEEKKVIEEFEKLHKEQINDDSHLVKDSKGKYTHPGTVCVLLWYLKGAEYGAGYGYEQGYEQGFTNVGERMEGLVEQRNNLVMGMKKHGIFKERE